MPVHPFDPPRGRLETLEIDAQSLRGNGIGDPSIRRVTVYLPEGYDDGDEEYPLFVELAGFTSSGLRRVGWQAFGENVPQRLDRLVSEGRMGPVVAAFPDGFTSLGGNQYVDSPVLGQWARFVGEELVEHLERRYRVCRRPGSRAVLGKSSGGYGALIQVMTGAGSWGAAACHSGDIGFEWLYLRDMPRTLDVLARHDGSVEQFVAHLNSASSVKGEEMHALMLLAMAASYDPDPESPLGVRLPVDPRTCRLDLERWQRWLECDPLRLLERDACADRLRSLRGLFVDCGFRDQYFLHYGARAFCDRLQELGIEHRFDEFDGTHSGIDHRLDESLPFLYRAVGGAPS